MIWPLWVSCSLKSVFFTPFIGNYNNNPGDDNIKPDGYAARDSTELGDSWVVPENNTVYVQELLKKF